MHGVVTIRVWAWQAKRSPPSSLAGEAISCTDYSKDSGKRRKTTRTPALTHSQLGRTTALPPPSVWLQNWTDDSMASAGTQKKNKKNKKKKKKNKNKKRKKKKKKKKNKKKKDR